MSDRPNPNTTIKQYTIRSFVKRTGRLSPSQQRALETLLPKYQTTDGDFDNNNPVHLEIGFGDGHSLVNMALNNPKINFLGIEVYDPGVGRLLNMIEKLHLTNIKIAHTDALLFIENQLKTISIERVMLFFPDPWHKKKHRKRRIIRPEFIQQIWRILTKNGIFHMATDWQDYAEQAVLEFNQFSGFRNLSKTNDYITRPNERNLTKFEKRGKRLGHNIWDMQWRKIP